MVYLATSNTHTGQSGAKATQYAYLQTAATGSFSGYAGWNKGMLSASSTACVNTTDTLLTNATNSAAGNVTVPAILFPATGLWSLVWGVRFAQSSTENNACFHVIAGKTYGESGSTGAANVRLAVTSTTAYNATVAWTGYAQAGDVFGLSAFSQASNALQPGASLGSALHVNLLSQTA